MRWALAVIAVLVCALLWMAPRAFRAESPAEGSTLILDFTDKLGKHHVMTTIPISTVEARDAAMRQHVEMAFAVTKAFEEHQ